MAKETKENQQQIFASALDIGTMFLQSAREDKDGQIVFNEVRDCYRELEYDTEFEDTLRNQNVPYVKDERKIYVLGNAAYSQARMAEFGADIRLGHESEILKRPMRDGILNPDSPKIAMTILRELEKICLEEHVGPARKNEVLVFSIPANPVDSQINNSFHAKTAERFLKNLGYDARPLGEGLAVVYAENPKMHMPEGKTIPFTGLGLSFGAGQVNFCLSERGLPIDEFSVARSGDYIDTNASRMTGQPRTKIIRVKEKDLDFNKIDESNEILMALDCYYEDMIKYVFSIFGKRFESNRGSIDYPIDIILSGGTASPPGFDKRVRKVLDRMNLPFQINEIRLAGGGDRQGMLKTVARGCYIRAKQTAKKIEAGKEVMNTLEKEEK
jgi:hypothetical protein